MIELEAQKETTAALTGTEYEPPENQNAMRVKAALYAIGNGLMNAAVEVGGGIQTLPDELKHGRKRPGGRGWTPWWTKARRKLYRVSSSVPCRTPCMEWTTRYFHDGRAGYFKPDHSRRGVPGRPPWWAASSAAAKSASPGGSTPRRAGASEAQGRVQPRDATQRQTQERGRPGGRGQPRGAGAERRGRPAVTEADVKTAAEISRATGREIRFYDGNTRRDPSGRANGYFDGNTIYVNSRSANPVAQIISHELTHSVEMADAYRDLSALVFDPYPEGRRKPGKAAAGKTGSV